MDFQSSDFLWSLFMASLMSYRRDTVLRPFPSEYLKENREKNFDRLVDIATECPPLVDVNSDPSHVGSEILNLLRWVLNPKNFTLTILEKRKFSELHELTSDCSTDVPEPDYIFEVKHNPSLEEKFQNLKGRRRSLFAYHGSKVENFYSILHCGLRNNLNKVALYGEGIYLSSDLKVSLMFSPNGRGWKHSMFGTPLCCVAFCEMIDHPDVKCTINQNEEQHRTNKDKSQPDSDTTLASRKPSASNMQVKNRKRSVIAGSEGGVIPEKYFVVRNDDLVRVRYLLLYSPHAKGKLVHQELSTIRRFLARHQFSCVMLFYVLILLIPSLYNSKIF